MNQAFCLNQVCRSGGASLFYSCSIFFFDVGTYVIGEKLFINFNTNNNLIDVKDKR